MMFLHEVAAAGPTVMWTVSMLPAGVCFDRPNRINWRSARAVRCALSDMSHPARITLLFSAFLVSQQAWCAQDNQREIDFPNHAQLVYSAPVSPELSRTFGPGWTRLTITRPDGTALAIVPDEALISQGGVIFSTVGARARSHDGRYVVLDLTRNGVTETEDGKPTVVSREFCPILDTVTGCVARDYSGVVCGGAWDDKEARWRSQLDSGKTDSQSMKALEKPTARAVWTQFSQAKATNIKPFLRVALGLDNLRACDPPSAANARYYAQIQAALGDASSAGNHSTPASTRAVPADADALRVSTVQVDRAWLYERPSVGSNRRGYLIRGDRVVIIGEQKPDWVRVRYNRAGKEPIEAWLERPNIDR
ncbi:SH3 domain-containing protein [Paraburkholderia caribensis]|uniref:SH3 domain-containing protein n=1 Tax=Paraburkholderia caribensis TaxID=75105 RepID=UPI0015906E3A|nr:SH3 domain-containing protein [Paraburkholderia caribensis]